MIQDNTLQRPAALPRAARIAVLAASSASTYDRIDAARQSVESRNDVSFQFASNLFEVHHQYLAGPDELRAAELNRLFRSDEFDAFFFARGGYGAMRILDALDFDAFRRNPRPVVGYSDVTALHQALAARAGVASFHGPMLNLDFHNGLSSFQETWFWSMLRGETPLRYEFEPGQVITSGRAEGVLFGGCLSLTAALMGTPYDYWIDDGIWFWEDIGEPAYRIDRMLTQLRLAGRFAKLRGVLIGRLKDCGDASGIETLRLASEFFGSLRIPVVRELPLGHHGDNLMLPIGVPVALNADDCSLTFEYPAVEARR